MSSLHYQKLVCLWQCVPCERLIYSMISNAIFLEGEVIVGDSNMLSLLFCINFTLSDTLLILYAKKLKNYTPGALPHNLILKHSDIRVLKHFNKFKKRW